MTNKPDVSKWLKARDSAFLSMDKKEIEAYSIEYGATIPKDEKTFWIGVHKARTGITSLPMWERAASKMWLLRRGYSSLDAGGVLPPLENTADTKKYFDRLSEFESMEACNV